MPLENISIRIFNLEHFKKDHDTTSVVEGLKETGMFLVEQSGFIPFKELLNDIFGIIRSIHEDVALLKGKVGERGQPFKPADVNATLSVICGKKKVLDVKHKGKWKRFQIADSHRLLLVSGGPTIKHATKGVFEEGIFEMPLKENQELSFYYNHLAR